MIVLENLAEMLRGVLEDYVLEIINRKETYGYGITRRLSTLGFTDVVDGAVYTMLVRPEKSKLAEINRKASDIGPPREFFTLSDTGREELRKFWERWEFVLSRMNELREKK